MSQQTQIFLSIVAIIASFFLIVVSWSEELHVPFDQAYLMLLGEVGLVVSVIWLVRIK